VPRPALALAVLLSLFACKGRDQADGLYLLTGEQVVRDDCSLAQHPDVLGSLELTGSGSVLYGRYSLHNIELVGGYLESPALTRAERFKRADALIDRFALREVAKSQGRFLSGGERRKLEIAQQW
jgi:ABC-type lipopolysaccharide export system ATPase subunit